MFGTKMELVTFIIIVIEFLILFSQILIYLSRPQDKSRLRFLSLVVVFILYNTVSGFLPDKNIKINLILQNVASIGSGITLAIFYYNYLVKELNMIQDKIFNVKNLIVGLSSTFILVFIPVSMLYDTVLARKSYILFPILIALYFCFKTVQFLVKKHKQHSHEKTPYQLLIVTGYVGIMFMATMPIVVFFGDYQTVNNGLVNVSLLLTFFAYTKHHLHHAKIEFELLKKVNKSNTDLNFIITDFTKFGFTKRELQIAHLMLQNLTYAEIANDLFIEKNTVSKHGSSLIKKAKCKNKSHFTAKFG